MGHRWRHLPNYTHGTLGGGAPITVGSGGPFTGVGGGPSHAPAQERYSQQGPLDSLSSRDRTLWGRGPSSSIDEFGAPLGALEGGPPTTKKGRGAPRGAPMGAPMGAHLIEEKKKEEGVIGAVHYIEVNIRKVYNLLLRGKAKGLLSSSSLSVAALWGPESRNLLLLQRSSRKVNAACSCELEPQTLGSAGETVQLLEQLYGRIFVNGRVS